MWYVSCRQQREGDRSSGLCSRSKGKEHEETEKSWQISVVKFSDTDALSICRRLRPIRQLWYRRRRYMHNFISSVLSFGFRDVREQTW